MLELLEFTEPLHKVTIIPRGPSLGSTMWLPIEDKYTQRRNELLDDLVVSMGGRVAEEIVFGDVTSGARGDIQMATRLARKMVCEWGMSDKMGMVEYGEHEDYVFLGRDISRARDYSEATAEQIDSEVRKLVDDAYARAKEILLTNREKLEVIAKALLEYETLDGAQIREVIEHGRLINPPPGPPATGPKLGRRSRPSRCVAPDVTPPLPGRAERSTGLRKVQQLRGPLVAPARRLAAVRRSRESREERPLALSFAGASALLFDQRLKLALHRLKGIVDHFAQRLVHLVRRRFLIDHQFVTRRDGDIDSDPEWITRLLRMVGCSTTTSQRLM